MGKLKENVDKRIMLNGKISIVLLNWFSRLIVALGIFAFIFSMYGIIDGIIQLDKSDTKYMELIQSEEYDFSLSSIGFTKEEFLERIDGVTTKDEVVANYVVCGIASVMDMLMLLVTYICAWVVTGSIRRDEERPFKKENFRALKKSAIALLVLAVLEFVFFLIFGVPESFNLGYLFIVCMFVYLFDAGCKLQEKK